MTAKRSVFFFGLVAVLLMLLSGSRTWVTGTISDAVLSNTAVRIGGSSAAPVVTAGALVGAAAVVAALTAGRLPRLIASVFAALAGILALVATLGVAGDPAGTVQSEAAGSTGHTGSVAATGTLTIWPWIGVLGAVLLILTGGLAFVGGRRWSGLSGRYDAPSAPARQASAWDQLSEGSDPTVSADIDAARDPEGDVPSSA